MRDRRQARIGTVSGLALLAGATALVAVSGGHHSIFATLLLGLLAIVMSHALVVEIQRQARRMSQVVWYRTDTANTVLLGCWAMIAAAVTNVPVVSLHVRTLTAVLAVGYAAACAYFVVERRRAVANPFGPSPIPLAASLADPTLADAALAGDGRVGDALGDTALVDAALVDAALVDVALVDAALVDVALVDAALVDVALVDAALVDVALVDAALVDAALVDAPEPVADAGRDAVPDSAPSA